MRCLLFSMVLAIALGTAGMCADVSAGRDVSIFKGDDPSQDGIDLSGWGSGLAVKSKEKLLVGGWAVKITTQSLYAGGRIDFTRPVALFSDGIDSKRYIQFAFFFNETQVVDPAAGANSWGDIEPYTMPKATKLRFVFISDNDTVVCAEQPTGALDPDDNWMRVAVPLAKFKPTNGDAQANGEPTEFRLKRLLVFSDVPSTMYLGEMKLVTDNTPIKVEPLDSQTLAIIDPVFLVANAQSGVSSLKYSWDFDSNNGIQAEVIGRVGRYVYTRGGDYTVTLTVSDVDGLKTPVTVTTKITVTD